MYEYNNIVTLPYSVNAPVKGLKLSQVFYNKMEKKYI